MDRNEVYDIYEYEVLDRDGDNLGKVTGFWVDDDTGRPEFASVKTGFIMGKEHLIPIRDASFDYGTKKLRVPYDQEVIKDAPSFEPDHNLTETEEAKVYSHYKLERNFEPGILEAGRTGGVARGELDRTATTRDVDRTAEIPLRGEQVNVGKREVADREVRLRKVVRTETKEVPVELRREKINIERVPADQLKGTFSGRKWGEAFREGEVVMRSSHEEPVVNKTQEVVGGVRATKDVDVERRNIEANVRREDVEIEGTDDENLGRRRRT